MITVQMRFYEGLNDFLPLDQQKISFAHTVASKAAIKDVIESLGVPHPEVQLILVNRKSVAFNYQVQNGDSISVYPVFKALNVNEISLVQPKPLEKTTFILDVHLGKLARYLRLLGFDMIYDNHFADATIAECSENEKRIVLTRDIGLLKNKKITYGYWIRNTDPEKQINEVLSRFNLYEQCKPFTRCIECNGMLISIEKNSISENLSPMTRKYYQNFVRCNLCKKIYWEGTHYQKLKNLVKRILINNKF